MSYRIVSTAREDVKFKARVFNSEPLMRGIGVRALSGILRRIDSGVGPENSALTKSIKQGDKTLRDNGQLLGSIHERHGADFAEVASNHIAAIVNNPPDLVTTNIIIKPKTAKALTIPAGPQTRTMMRRYGLTPRACIEGMMSAGYEIYRPFKKGSKTRSNVIMAVLPQTQKTPLVLTKSAGGKKGPIRLASKYQPFALFFLASSVRVPIRRFLYLDELELALIENYTQEYYLGGA